MRALAPTLAFEFFRQTSLPEAPFQFQGQRHEGMLPCLSAHQSAADAGDEGKWARARYDLCVQASLAKFEQHPHLAAQLINTGAAVLALAEPMDLVWGTGLEWGHPDATNPTLWPGRNLMGFALMEVRRQLAARSRGAHVPVTPAPVLMSACLCGAPVRYDGKDVPCSSDILTRWRQAGRILALCPEMAGGLPAPRPPAEITPGASGEDVWAGCAQVLDRDGRDWTVPFLIGAHRTVDLALEHGIKVAVLKSRSPSCGHERIYDGRFAGVLTPGNGVTAAALRRAGVAVFDELTLAEADRFLQAQS